MLALFLNLIDRIAALVKLRQSDRQQLFKEVVEPLFVQLQPVVDNYFTIFRNARQSLARAGRSQAELVSAVEEIRNFREQMLHLRRMVTAMASEIEKHVDDERVVRFSAKVARFFYSTQNRSRSRLSGSRELVDLCDYVVESGLDRNLILEYVDATLRQLEQNWVTIAQLYAALRIHCVTPDRYRQ